MTTNELEVILEVKPLVRVSLISARLARGSAPIVRLG